MISDSSIRSAPAKAGARAVFALLATFALAMAVSCSDGAAPAHPATTPTIKIAPLADSVFEGDVVQLTGRVFDEAGVEVPGAPVTWTVSDTTLARVAGQGGFALLRPGTVRVTAHNGAAAGTYDIVIGRLVVTRLELTPGTLSLGRGDRVQVDARAVGQGGRAITGRTITFTSDDTLIAIIGSPDNVVGSPGFLIAVGPGSTTIRASVDGVAGSAHVGVVVGDTTFALTHFNGSPLPVLIAADSVIFNGVPELDEVYADSGTLVLSGLAQERYQLDVQYSQYQVIRTGDTVQRELRLRVRGEFDRGLVTVGANGGLSMLSEFIGPHLEHTAAIQSDGYLVHYQIPGDFSFLDLQYRRITP